MDPTIADETSLDGAQIYYHIAKLTLLPSTPFVRCGDQAKISLMPSVLADEI